MRYFLLVLDLASRYIILFDGLEVSSATAFVCLWFLSELFGVWFSVGFQKVTAVMVWAKRRWQQQVSWPRSGCLEKQLLAPVICTLPSCHLVIFTFFFFPPHFFSVLSSFLMAQVLYGTPASDSLTCNLFSFWNSRSQICGKSSSTLP